MIVDAGVFGFACDEELSCVSVDDFVGKGEGVGGDLFDDGFDGEELVEEDGSVEFSGTLIDGKVNFSIEEDSFDESS